MFKKHKDRNGFTILELLIVISLMGILAVVTLGGYNRTRQSAELSLQIDNFITDLREQKNSVKNANEQKCLGLQIEDKKIYKVEAEYINPFSKCGQAEIVDDQSNLTAERIKRDEQVRPLEQITILFYPPKGESYLPEIDQQGQASSEGLTFEFSLGDATNNQIVTFNSSNGSVQKSFKNAEPTSDTSTVATTPPASSTPNVTPLPDTPSTPAPIPAEDIEPTYTEPDTQEGTNVNVLPTTQSPQTTETPKQNPITLIALVLAAIILGAYFTRYKN